MVAGGGGRRMEGGGGAKARKLYRRESNQFTQVLAANWLGLNLHFGCEFNEKRERQSLKPRK